MAAHWLWLVLNVSVIVNRYSVVTWGGGAVGWGTTPQDGRGGFPASITCRVVADFQVTYLFSAFDSPGAHSARNRNEYQGIFLRGTVRLARGADDCVVPAVPNVKLTLEIRHPTSLSGSMICYWGALPGCRRDEGLHRFSNKWLVWLICVNTNACS
jgi:hypothetical protein